MQYFSNQMIAVVPFSPFVSWTFLEYITGKAVFQVSVAGILPAKRGRHRSRCRRALKNQKYLSRRREYGGAARTEVERGPRKTPRSPRSGGGPSHGADGHFLGKCRTDRRRAGSPGKCPVSPRSGGGPSHGADGHFLGKCRTDRRRAGSPGKCPVSPRSGGGPSHGADRHFLGSQRRNSRTFLTPSSARYLLPSYSMLTKPV